MKRHWHHWAIALLLLLSFQAAFAQSDRLEMARRHMVRGLAAIEMVKSKGDLSEAAKEFREATELAPEMADAWYNLGTVLAKQEKYADAAAAYQKYVDLKPDSADAQKVRDEIIKLQYRQERHDAEFQPGWTLIGTAEDGTKVYTDKSTIKRTEAGGSVLTVWDSSTPQKFRENEYYSLTWLYDFDCGKGKYRLVGGGLFTGHMGEGTSLATFTPSSPPVWSDIAEKPVIPEVFKLVCDKVR
ncbi:MAG TPA: tetratricopeptide repeat protein [Parasulfuritortus sp.]